jgi:hypothetical protein
VPASTRSYRGFDFWGTIDGFELSRWLYGSPKWPPLVPYVTANVNLWPQMDVLLANPARLER